MISVPRAAIPLVQACKQLAADIGQTFSAFALDALRNHRRNVMRRRYRLDDGTACRYTD
jgi:hypothetical protein